MYFSTYIIESRQIFQSLKVLPSLSYTEIQ